MSNIYISEPSTSGKVVLKTTVGELEIELWSREAPRACRNFVQLCMEGYYDGTLFHRVVKNFLVQGGDPTGTGDGGESIYGEPFKTEVHSRLRFTRRGLLAMSCPEADHNNSQFFFTLAAAPELDKKHTIFGKVVGDTIYNLIKLNDCETDGDERPLNPQKIISTKVISNPFPDVEVRQKIRHETMTQEEEEEAKKPRSKCAATKNFSLLSFGEEVEEEIDNESRPSQIRGKSAHDLLDDPIFAKEAEMDANGHVVHPEEDGIEGDAPLRTSGRDERSTEEQISELRQRLAAPSSSHKHAGKNRNAVDVADDVTWNDESSKKEEKMKKRDELRRESERLRLEILAQKHRPELEELQRQEKAKEEEEARERRLHTGNEVLDSLRAEQEQYRRQHDTDLPLTPPSTKREPSPRTTDVEEATSSKDTQNVVKDEIGVMRDNSKKKAKLSAAELDHEARTLQFFSRFTNRLHDLVTKGPAVAKEVDEGFKGLTQKLDVSAEVAPTPVLDANVYNPERYPLDDPRHPINQRKRQRHKDGEKSSRSTDRHSQNKRRHNERN